MDRRDVAFEDEDGVILHGWPYKPENEANACHYMAHRFAA
jgi:hypothetical protein